ncbi:MAG: tetratricopeptide repeat protein [Candidatus Eiseniibacteriota bacterium]|nr:MAG: tetratricopeptide repeat protein [Candidatus Eisenbacteria bacterium]
MQKSSVIKAQAQKYLSGGNLDKALAEYEKLLAMDDVDPYDFVLAGDVQLKKGATDKALVLYGQAVDAYEKVGLYKNAAAIGKRVLRLDPSLCEMYKRLGRIRASEGLVTEAAQDFLKYHEIMLRNGDREGATEGLELACKAMPRDAALSEKLAKFYEEADRTADAARELARISQVMRDRGDEEKAASFYERALQLDAEALSMPVVEEESRTEEPAPEKSSAVPAEETIEAPGEVSATDEEEAKKDSPVEIPEEFRSGSINVKEKVRFRPPAIDIAEVLKQFKAQVDSKVGTDDYQCRYDLGVTYKEMGLFEEALNEFRVAAADDKQRAKAFEMAGLCHFEMNEYEEALEAFRRALQERTRQDEDYPGLCFNLGVTLEAMGRTEEALDTFKEVASINPEFPGLASKLLILGRQGGGTSEQIA